MIGLNPLHAMFQDEPEHASPYSPASRLLLNVLNIDVTALPELAECVEAADRVASESFQQELDDCRAQRLVDYSRVTALKMPVLRKLFEACRDAGDQTRWQGFRSFSARAWARCSSATACTLRCASISPTANRPARTGMTGRRSIATRLHRRWQDSRGEHRQDLDFLVWLQWVADEQLGAAAAAAADCGMAVGLYRDLAVGADRAGAETWANAAAVVSDAQVGAPPDIFNPAGQDWGLPPFQPRALREEGYRSFIELIRANMRHAGGLANRSRDGPAASLLGTRRDRAPSAGAYVQYPMEDMVGILALESHRQRCLVVGEDLGTVPEGFRERMSAANILSYRVLFFEQDDDTGAFLPPAAYPSLALAVIGSHDLPTSARLVGGPRPGDQGSNWACSRTPLKPRQRASSARLRDREALLQALRDAGPAANGGRAGHRDAVPRRSCLPGAKPEPAGDGATRRPDR